MIDFAHIENYKENNRIEAKKAIGGLPHSIWETYSAFANTLGGVILLGVEEHADKSLHPVALLEPEKLVKDFWDSVNNTNKVSVNILSDKDVTIEEVEGKRIVAIRVPRAQRGDKPVFIDGNPLAGSYRRNGEGDYRCTKEEVQAMLRDASVKTQDIKVPFKLEGGDRIDDTPVHKALREALANCLINADYYGRQGLVIVKKKDSIIFSNPGGFRIDVEAAQSGGVSDPRNSALIKMFNLIDVGERAGSGIPNIFSVWKKQGWPAPVITESFEPDRISLSLLMGESSDKKVAIKSGDKKVAIKSGDKTAKTLIQRQAIIDYLTENVMAKTSDIAVLLGVKDSRARYLLAEMVEEGIVAAEGEKKYRVYKLKA